MKKYRILMRFGYVVLIALVLSSCASSPTNSQLLGVRMPIQLVTSPILELDTKDVATGYHFRLCATKLRFLWDYHASLEVDRVRIAVWPETAPLYQWSILNLSQTSHLLTVIRRGDFFYVDGLSWNLLMDEFKGNYHFQLTGFRDNQIAYITEFETILIDDSIDDRCAA